MSANTCFEYPDDGWQSKRAAMKVTRSPTAVHVMSNIRHKQKHGNSLQFLCFSAIHPCNPPTTNTHTHSILSFSTHSLYFFLHFQSPFHQLFTHSSAPSLTHYLFIHPFSTFFLIFPSDSITSDEKNSPL